MVYVARKRQKFNLILCLWYELRPTDVHSSFACKLIPNLVVKHSLGNETLAVAGLLA